MICEGGGINIYGFSEKWKIEKMKIQIKNQCLFSSEYVKIYAYLKDVERKSWKIVWL